jgi:Eco57I restriction-modification methylase
MSKLNIPRTRDLLQRFEFKNLFVDELGWERHSASLRVSIEGVAYELHAVAEKRGLVAFVCNPLSGGGIPDYATRRKIETHVAKTVHEHIVVYADRDKTAQVWQWVKREPGKPAACREHTYRRHQSGDSLIQKLDRIVFTLHEEENLTIVDSSSRVRDAFDPERVTKKFYKQFEREHEAFLRFLKGIPDEEMQRWYVSVMINRLMFIYFVQQKDFLGDDNDYLRHQLARSKDRGKDLFYSEFLCPLFFDGFAKKESERSAATNKLLGKVPYLNGGIFQRHELEDLYGGKIKVCDAAFEKLFGFFAEWDWHLDDRPLRDDREINPDVLGYIFEKYINQKQMGAYYTKEDITEYISKNTIIPCLIEKARQKCKIAFEGEALAWRLLKEDPDKYIYKPLRHGVTWDVHLNKRLDQPRELPAEITAGLENVSNRSEWNKSAPADYALPTEIWREVVARRRRYDEVSEKLISSNVRDINDLITYNLDIRQFAQDVITNSEGPELLRAFWHALVGRTPEKSNEKFENGISILDPTCGSGAFLFAALNILEPLYDACLDRMQGFLDDLERSEEKHDPRRFNDFRKVLERVERHPNHRYFVLKSIIINNLFGVDIMEEAVEICKLRLFLKLVAQIERGEQIEPLPDIDFNIRAGNSLVGYATYNDVKQAVTSKLDFEDSIARIEDKAKDIDDLYNLFRQQQTNLGGEVTATAKKDLNDRLRALEDELNAYLAGEYAIDPSKKTRFESWLRSHKPFHWFIEFHSIIAGGAFDAIIGNPPYVEYKNVKETYLIRDYRSENCRNVYAFTIERSLGLLHPDGRLGLIIPVSFASAGAFNQLRAIISDAPHILWLSHFANRPSQLFSGAQNRLTIVLRGPNDRVII